MVLHDHPRQLTMGTCAGDCCWLHWRFRWKQGQQNGHDLKIIRSLMSIMNPQGKRWYAEQVPQLVFLHRETESDLSKARENSSGVRHTVE